MEVMREVWASMTHWWGGGVFGISLENLLLGLLVFAVFFLLRGMLARGVLRLLRRVGKEVRVEVFERVAKALERPLRFLFPVLGLFLFETILSLPESVDAFAAQAFRSLFVIALFWLVYGLVELLVDVVEGATRSRVSVEIEQWLCRSLRILIVLVAGATVLDIWGVAIAPILAGLGIGGVAVALGAQDLFKNLIGGAAILVEKRFGIGDWIRVDGVVEGTVERIGYRSTLVRQFDQAPVHLPNYQLSDAAVVNYSAMLYRRIYWKVGLSYSSSVAQLREVRDGIEEYVINNDAFESSAKVSTFVRVDKFSDSSIDILLYCFTKTTNWGEWLAIKEALLYRIKEIVEGAGTSFAFPSRSLYVESLPHGTPAAFAEPPERQLTPPRED